MLEVESDESQHPYPCAGTLTGPKFPVFHGSGFKVIPHKHYIELHFLWNVIMLWLVDFYHYHYAKELCIINMFGEIIHLCKKLK